MRTLRFFNSLSDRTCNVQCIELSHAQRQTTIQAVISCITTVDGILCIYNLPVHFLVNSSIFMFGKFLHITYPLHTHVCAMEKHFNRYQYRFHQLQRQTLLLGASLSHPGDPLKASVANR